MSTQCCGNVGGAVKRERENLAGCRGRRCANPKNMGGLGFRDIKLFNLALLARQGWRLLQNPESPSAKILKARYYPYNDFLQSELGSLAGMACDSRQFAGSETGVSEED
jgi:hypothetical protein